MIRLTPEGSQPYSVIVADIRAIRGFLQGRASKYDEIWIPGEADVRRAEAILRRARGRGLIRSRDEARGRPSVVPDVDGYNREYGGFKRGKAKLVLCRMSQCSSDVRPPENHFSGRAMDDWRVFLFAVVALDAQRVERLEWEGF